jgi:hypothetical protein
VKTVPSSETKASFSLSSFSQEVAHQKFIEFHISGEVLCEEIV